MEDSFDENNTRKKVAQTKRHYISNIIIIVITLVISVRNYEALDKDVIEAIEMSVLFVCLRIRIERIFLIDLRLYEDI